MYIDSPLSLPKDENWLRLWVSTGKMPPDSLAYALSSCVRCGFATDFQFWIAIRKWTFRLCRKYGWVLSLGCDVHSDPEIVCAHVSFIPLLVLAWLK
jgi:hypothetical protein